MLYTSSQCFHLLYGMRDGPWFAPSTLAFAMILLPGLIIISIPSTIIVPSPSPSPCSPWGFQFASAPWRQSIPSKLKKSQIKQALLKFIHIQWQFYFLTLTWKFTMNDGNASNQFQCKCNQSIEHWPLSPSTLLWSFMKSLEIPNT